jgi:putative spermidine/putrescine transport system permease protein
MAAVDVAVRPSTPPAPKQARDSLPWGRWVIFLVAALYFLVPLLVAFLFTIRDPLHHGITFRAYRDVISSEGFTTSFRMSFTLALITIVVTLGLLLPTMLLVALRYPKVRGAIEVLCLLPLVFPPVVLVVGVGTVLRSGGDTFAGTPIQTVMNQMQKQDLPLILAFEYVVLALPFSYRALDAGLRAIDIRVLVEAAQNLGASWLTILFRVLIPSLRTAVFNAAFLSFALVMGEYTIAKILLFKPLSVWTVQLPSADGQIQTAVSLLSLLITWLLLLLAGTLSGRASLFKRKRTS